MKFVRKINENLDIIGTDPGGPAAASAKKRGLVYVGFGRYMDPKSGQVTHIIQDDQLLPFNQVVQSNEFQNSRQDDVGMASAVLQPQTDEVHGTLLKHYAATKYDSRELAAIQHFTDLGHIEINNRLAQLPSGVPHHKIERQTPDDQLPDLIGSLDSALKRSRSPRDFVTYAKIHDQTDLNNLKPGSTFKFKGFRNTSLNLPTVIGNSPPTIVSPEGRPTVNLLQLNIKKHTRGLYASDYSPTPDDREFVLPRGAEVKIADHPKTLVGSDGSSGITNLQIRYYNAEVKG